MITSLSKLGNWGIFLLGLGVFIMAVGQTGIEVYEYINYVVLDGVELPLIPQK
jgi:hypothetical protein